MKNLYNEDYYENGVKTKTSGYENYHWIPTRSYSEAIEITKEFNDCNTILDYGCAKGYLVHALRQLGRNAFGEDISEYAILSGHPSVKGYISTSKIIDSADLIICKDVLEHISETDLPSCLCDLYNRCNKYAFFAIPLGDNDTFRIREYEMDITHVTKKDEDWWISMICSAGFKLERFDYSFGRMKSKWTAEYEFGNGFFIFKV